MADKMERFDQPQQTVPTNAAEKRGWLFFILLNAAGIMRAAALLIGAGFFGLILLLGMGMAMHMLTLSGAWMVMGFALLISVLISLLTYYVTTQVNHFREKLFEQTLHSLPPADLLLLQTQMQKLLEVLLALQKELQTKEKNIHTDDRPPKN